MHTEMAIDRVASSSKVGKSAALGVSGLYVKLRKAGRMWRAENVFAREVHGGRGLHSSTFRLDVSTFRGKHLALSVEFSDKNGSGLS